MKPEFANDLDTVRQRIREFNQQISGLNSESKRDRKILYRLSQCRVWVVDDKSKRFAPAMFAGIKYPELRRFHDRERIPPNWGTDHILNFPMRNNLKIVSMRSAEFGSLAAQFVKWKQLSGFGDWLHLEDRAKLVVLSPRSVRRTDKATRSQKTMPDASEFSEGAPVERIIKSFIRNAGLRLAALREHGFVCAVCREDFGYKYGGLGKRCIQVHHLEPFSTSRGHRVTSMNEVCSVCSNCHAMLHSTATVPGIDEFRDILLQFELTDEQD
jgi:hypothetical protein